MSTAELGQQLAAAALALSAATGELALVPLDAAAAATMMGLLERSHRAIAYAQLLITRRAATAEVHRLDPATEAPPSTATTSEETTGESPQPETFEPSPSGTPTFCPAGTPAPEWARPAGASGSDIPLSELACGLPPDGSGLGQLTSQDPRTNPQLLLDALIAACAGVMDGPDIAESGGMRVKIGVLIGYRSLLGQCEDAGLTDHNRPISAANVRRLACDGDILPAVMGEDGAVLDLGREVRGFTKAQRRAIAIRDRGCTIPGCKRPASMSECHHVLPWSQGGPTSVANSALLREYHHLQVHAGLVTLKSINGVPYVIEIAGQARGAPQRNLDWHPELRTAGYQAPLFELAPGTRRCQNQPAVPHQAPGCCRPAGGVAPMPRRRDATAAPGPLDHGPAPQAWHTGRSPRRIPATMAGQPDGLPGRGGGQRARSTAPETDTRMLN